MRGSNNRQTVSSTARWNLAQSDSASAGAQKKPLKNRQTGQGSNIIQLKRALASAELHFAQTADPRTKQNIAHGIELLRAQIARVSGVDYSGVDLNSVPESATGYVFAGYVQSDSDFGSSAVAKAGVDQSPISPFAQFQLFGTLRQKISKVAPPTNATPAGSPVYPGAPQTRSNVLRTPNNPEGSVFPTGVPGSIEGYHPQQDTRDSELSSGRWYRQDDPATHANVHTGRGHVVSPQIARGKHGQYKGGFVFTPDNNLGGNV